MTKLSISSQNQNTEATEGTVLFLGKMEDLQKIAEYGIISFEQDISCAMSIHPGMDWAVVWYPSPIPDLNYKWSKSTTKSS